MNQLDIGSLIAELRREKGITQQNLAEKLNVTNRAVSKWERGEGCPEITTLPKLAYLLGVTVDELLNGEKLTREETDPETKPETPGEIFDAKKLTDRIKTSCFISVLIIVFGGIISYFIFAIDYGNSTIQAIGSIIAFISCSGGLIFYFLMNIKNDYAKNSKTHFCFYQNAIRGIWTFGVALCIFISILSGLNSNNDSLSLACFILGFGYLILYIGTMLFWRSKAAYGREFEIMKPQTADYIAASYMLLIFIAAVYFNINFMQYEIRRYIFLGSTVLFAVVSIFLCLRHKDPPLAVKALRNILIGIAVQIQIVFLNAPAVLNKINVHFGILTEEQIKNLKQTA